MRIVFVTFDSYTSTMYADKNLRSLNDKKQRQLVTVLQLYYIKSEENN